MPRRRVIPRFNAPNHAANCRAIDGLKAFARKRDFGVAVAALALVLDRRAHPIPIAGTRSAPHLADRARADRIGLTPADRAKIARLLPVGFAWGDRPSDDQAQSVERYCEPPASIR